MSAVHRLPWNDFPDVVVQTNVGKLKAHPDYARAKSGDPDAAIRVAAQLAKLAKVRAEVDAVVPVLQVDASRRNAIPPAYAALLARELRAAAVAGIYQLNRMRVAIHTLDGVRDLKDAFWQPTTRTA